MAWTAQGLPFASSDVPVAAHTSYQGAQDATPMPFSGSTPASRHASWTGAQAALATRTAKQSAYMQLLNQAEALTDHEAAALLHWPLASVNSTRNGINDAAVREGKLRVIGPDGYDIHEFRNSAGQWEATKRTRWKVLR